MSVKFRTASEFSEAVLKIVSERKKDDVFGRLQQKMGELYKNREKVQVE